MYTQQACVAREMRATHELWSSSLFLSMSSVYVKEHQVDEIFEAFHYSISYNHIVIMGREAAEINYFEKYKQKETERKSISPCNDATQLSLLTSLFNSSLQVILTRWH